jgi:hypothetical protein
MYASACLILLYVCVRMPHTAICMRPHASYCYMCVFGRAERASSIRCTRSGRMRPHASYCYMCVLILLSCGLVSIRQHTSHTSAYVSIRRIRQHTSAYVLLTCGLRLRILLLYVCCILGVGAMLKYATYADI